MSRARTGLPRPVLAAATPILRSFDDAAARGFYLGFLGFDVLFEHRFDPHSPLYMGLVRDGCHLHLSEHFGDCARGAHVRIPVRGLVAYQQALTAQEYRNAPPGPPERKPWGDLELTLHDPFANRLTFFEGPER